MNTFKWLMKREYWEHRGGFLWTPFWITATVMILSVLGIVWAEVAGRRYAPNISFGIPWDKLSAEISSGNLVQAGQGLDIIFVMFALLVSVALVFVVFFYLLGALYDDRKDRSVLFWKSLPVSDSQSVLAKVTTAAIGAPLIAFVIATIAYGAFLLVVTIWAALHGINPLPVIAHSNPFGMFWRMLLTLPVDALWALPAIGWLLLCSAFARSKPFLWAVLLPIGVIVVNGWIAAMGMPHVNGKVLTQDIVGRLIFSIVPGSWLDNAGKLQFGNIADQGSIANGDGLLSALDPGRVYAIFGTADMWIGIVVGSLMIVAAIWVRRRRIESAV